MPALTGVAALGQVGPAPLLAVQNYNASATAVLLQSLPKLFPAQTVPFIDAKTLQVTNEWYRYLAASLESSTSGVNALDPAAVAQAIQDSRDNVLRLQNLTVAMNAMLVQNAASATAAVSAVQAIAVVAAPTVVAQANAIPPVQQYIPEGV